MRRHFRHRNIFMIGGSLVIMLYLYLSDPNNGQLTLPFLAKLGTPIIAVWFAHLARKALFDYIDLESLVKKSKETATGAGLTFIGMCIVIFGLLSLFGSQVYAQDVKTYIPEQAKTHISTLVNEQKINWDNHPNLQPLEH